MNPEIEKMARQLCKESGQEPERRIPEYGRSSYSYPAWLDWVDLAKANLVCDICHGSGKISHPISLETRGPEIDAERVAWAKLHPVDCPFCGALCGREGLMPDDMKTECEG